MLRGEFPLCLRACLVGLILISSSLQASVSHLERWAQGHSGTSFRGDHVQSSLGALCLHLRPPKGSLPCHPADLAQGESDKPYFFTTTAYAGGALQEIYDFDQYISQHKSLDLIESLFFKRRVTWAEAAASIHGRYGRLGLALSPIEATYFSMARSDSNPRLAIQVMQSRSLRLSWGDQIAENVNYGVSLRAVNKKFIQDDLFLLEALSAPDQYLQVREQNSFFVEPGVKYGVYQGRWPMVFSLYFSQLGWTDRKYEGAKPLPGFNVGSSLGVPVPKGELQLAYSINRPAKGRYRWGDAALGITYELEKSYVFGSIEDSKWGLGYEHRFDLLRLGLSYQSERFHEFAYLSGERGRETSFFFSLSLTL